MLYDNDPNKKYEKLVKPADEQDALMQKLYPSLYTEDFDNELKEKDFDEWFKRYYAREKENWD